MRIRERMYHGIDRFPWEDFDVAYYEKRLPTELLPIWKKLDRDSGFIGTKVLKDYHEAKAVFRFSGEKTEIIAIWSPEFDEIKGAVEYELRLEYLGIDCICLGEWSVLLSGVYFRPNEFSAIVPRLNHWGLLSSDADCEMVIDRYLELSKNEIVEPLMANPKFTNVRIYKVPMG